MSDQKSKAPPLRSLRAMPVPARLLGPAWPGGFEKGGQSETDQKALAAKSRFLLRSAERRPEIVEDLFAQLLHAFRQAATFVDMKAVLADHFEFAPLKSARFFKGLTLDDENSEISDDQLFDLLPMERKKAIVALDDGFEKWAGNWRLNNSVFYMFCLEVLIIASPSRLPGLVAAKDWHTQAWRRVAEDYLRMVHMKRLTQLDIDLCRPPKGFKVYTGQGRDEYIAEQEKESWFWIENGMWVTQFAALPLAYRKQMVGWVKEEAMRYCDRVDAALQQSGAQRKRVEPTFARDIEWTVERRILNWDWERVAKESGESVDVAKKGVRKILKLLELPLAPSFDEPKGLHRK